MELIRDNWDVPPASLADKAPTKEEMKFNTTWVSETKGWYSIHVRKGPVDIISKRIGGGFNRHKGSHDIHLFSKGKSGKDKLWKMELEVARILALNTNSPFTGIQYLSWTGPRQAAQNTEDTQQDIFHSIFEVELNYTKAIQ